MNQTSTLAKVAGALVLLSLLVPSALAVQQQLQIQVVANSPVFAGQTVEVTAVVLLDNGTTVGQRATFTGKVYYPNGTAITLAAPTILAGGGLVKWTYTLPSNAPDGLYSVYIYATLAGTNSTAGLGSFTVNSQIASKGGLTSIMTSLTSVSTQLGTLSTNLASLSLAIKGNFSAVLSEMSTNFATLAAVTNSISTTQTHILTSLKANITTVLNTMSNDYGLMSAALSTGFGGVHTSIGGLSTDLLGNFTMLSGALSALRTSLGALATSASISGLSDSLKSGFGSVNAALGSLATSAQASALMTSIQSLSNQAALSSDIQDFLLLPVALLALIIIAFLFFRKRPKPS